MMKIREDIKTTLRNVNRSITDLCKATGIDCKRLSGILNGYCNFQSDEEYNVRQVLSVWTDNKEDVCGY